jgi:HK97 family phage major capsid protein
MMTKDKLAALQKAGLEHTQKARELLEQHGDDPTKWSASVKADYDDAMKTGRDYLERIKTAKADLEVLDAAADLAAEVGPPVGKGGSTTGRGHLALTGTHAKALAGRMVRAMPRNGTKALASGQQTTSTIMATEIVATGRPAQSLLDVLPARLVAPSYSFLRQSARTNNAAPVAEGGTKPTSVVSVTEVENRLRVVAHLSEQIPHYLLGDNDQLEKFVRDELIWGLRKAVENEVIAGDGTGEHFTGILNTSGVLVQAFATNALTSVRKGLTTLDVAGYEAGVIVLSAGDWETIELAVASTNAIEHMSLPIDPVARRLWGVPVVLNQGLGAKTGLVIGKDAVVLDHDGNVNATWSDAVSDDFAKNFIRCRVEGRFGVSCAQPGAVVKVGTAA